MRSSSGDKVRLQHIYDAVLEIESYVQKSTYEEFQSNTMMQFACVKQLEIIGEAANHFPTFFSSGRIIHLQSFNRLRFIHFWY